MGREPGRCELAISLRDQDESPRRAVSIPKVKILPIPDYRILALKGAQDVDVTLRELKARP
jgi:hypothetical protein